MLKMRLDLIGEHEILVAEDVSAASRWPRRTAGPDPDGSELPVIDGWEATRRLKASGDTPNSIIALSAHAPAGAREKRRRRVATSSTPPVQLDRLLGRSRASSIGAVEQCASNFIR